MLSFTGRVDLLLIDGVMPRLNGAALVREPLERWPAQRVPHRMDR